MSDVFFEVLDMPRPDYNLGVGSGSHARQTADMMHGLEDVFEREKPDLVLVYGDTNSTLAGALVASKMGRPLGHVEAGLRSFNRSMPEEINRIVTDHLSALLFCPTQTAVDNLGKEGISRGVHLVGDVMYDVALQSAQAARSRDILQRFGVQKGEYVLVTLHRPASVDDRGTLEGIVDALIKSGRTVVFPIHPRTRKNLESFGLWEPLRATVKAIEPVDYLDFIALLMGASKVVTDSGGVQKEAYFFGVPCITLLSDTDRYETCDDGCELLGGPETGGHRSRPSRRARFGAGAVDVDHVRVRTRFGDAHLPEPPRTDPDLSHLRGANREREMGDRVLRRRGGWGPRLPARALRG